MPGWNSLCLSYVRELKVFSFKSQQNEKSCAAGEEESDEISVCDRADSDPFGML